MQSQVKAKTKLDIQKGLIQLSNVLSAKSKLRQIIDGQAQQIASERLQTIHETDSDRNKPFICTEWNKHKSISGSFRSPYTNNYFPPTQQNNSYPSPILRDLQEKGNLLFQQYARLYYGSNGLISNFYVYETEEGINVIFVLKKQYNDECMSGVWSSTNFCQIRGDPLKSATYKLMTSILYELKVRLNENKDFVNISGSLKKNKADAKKPMQQYEIDQFHLMTVGKLVQQNQTFLRQQLESIFLAKSKQISSKNRFPQSKREEQRKIQIGKQFTKLRLETNRLVQ